VEADSVELAASKKNLDTADDAAVERPTGLSTAKDNTSSLLHASNDVSKSCFSTLTISTR